MMTTPVSQLSYLPYIHSGDAATPCVLESLLCGKNPYRNTVFTEGCYQEVAQLGIMWCCLHLVCRCHYLQSLVPPPLSCTISVWLNLTQDTS